MPEVACVNQVIKVHCLAAGPLLAWKTKPESKERHREVFLRLSRNKNVSMKWQDTQVQLELFGFNGSHMSLLLE